MNKLFTRLAQWWLLRRIKRDLQPESIDNMPQPGDVQRVMWDLAQHLQSAVLVGRPVPSVQALKDRMYAPEAGDMVFECTNNRTCGVGHLVCVLGENCWLVQDLFTGEMCNWYNATFLAIPDYQKWAQRVR